MQAGTTKDQDLCNKPSAAVHPGALATGTLPQYNTTLIYNGHWCSSHTDTRKGGAEEPTTKYIIVVSNHHTETQEKVGQRNQQQNTQWFLSHTYTNKGGTEDPTAKYVMVVGDCWTHKERCKRVTKCNVCYNSLSHRKNMKIWD